MTPHIPIILGTNRQERRSEFVANFILDQMQGREELTTELIDVRDYEMPSDDYGPNLSEKHKEFVNKITKADGIFIVCPEYNHSYPGVLKSLMDICYKEYKNKAAALAVVSAGQFGGARAAEHLQPLLRAYGLHCLQNDLFFPKVDDIFDEEGSITNDRVIDRTYQAIDDLLWLTKALKAAREK